MAGIFLNAARTVPEGGRRVPRADPELAWPYRLPHAPAPEEMAKEFNGYALADLPDPKDPTKVIVKEGQQLASFAQLQGRRHHRLRLLDFLRRWTEKPAT